MKNIENIHQTRGSLTIKKKLFEFEKVSVLFFCVGFFPSDLDVFYAYVFLDINSQQNRWYFLGKEEMQGFYVHRLNKWYQLIVKP